MRLHTQNSPGFGPWGFDSPSRHQDSQGRYFDFDLDSDDAKNGRCASNIAESEGICGIECASSCCYRKKLARSQAADVLACEIRRAAKCSRRTWWYLRVSGETLCDVV